LVQSLPAITTPQWQWRELDRFYRLPFVIDHVWAYQAQQGLSGAGPVRPGEHPGGCNCEACFKPVMEEVKRLSEYRPGTILDLSEDRR